MNFNLRMLNCWIGLCRQVPPLPADIAQAGYADKWIEQTFKTAARKECKPELVIASQKQKHAVLWEWKDGRTINLDQLRRYATATHEDLVERAYLANNECQQHDAVLLVKEEHVDNTVALLDREGLLFPVIGAFPGCFKMVRGKLSAQVLSTILTEFACDWENSPVSFVPLDRDSPIEEVAVHVITLILQRLLRRDSVIRSIDLCPDVCPLFPAMGSEARNDVESKITEIFAAAARHEFSPYLNFKKGNNSSSQLGVNSNPFEIGDDKRSRGFKRMKKLQVEFVDALSQGHRPPPPPTLFDNLGSV